MFVEPEFWGWQTPSAVHVRLGSKEVVALNASSGSRSKNHLGLQVHNEPFLQVVCPYINRFGILGLGFACDIMLKLQSFQTSSCWHSWPRLPHHFVTKPGVSAIDLHAESMLSLIQAAACEGSERGKRLVLLLTTVASLQPMGLRARPEDIGSFDW